MSTTISRPSPRIGRTSRGASSNHEDRRDEVFRCAPRVMRVFHRVNLRRSFPRDARELALADLTLRSPADACALSLTLPAVQLDATLLDHAQRFGRAAGQARLLEHLRDGESVAGDSLPLRACLRVSPRAGSARRSRPAPLGRGCAVEARRRFPGRADLDVARVAPGRLRFHLPMVASDCERQKLDVAPHQLVGDATSACRRSRRAAR